MFLYIQIHKCKAKGKIVPKTSSTFYHRRWYFFFLCTRVRSAGLRYRGMHGTFEVSMIVRRFHASHESKDQKAAVHRLCTGSACRAVAGLSLRVRMHIQGTCMRVRFELQDPGMATLMRVQKVSFVAVWCAGRFVFRSTRGSQRLVILRDLAVTVADFLDCT